MNFLSGRGAEKLTVYGWNTKVSVPFVGLEQLWFLFEIQTFVTFLVAIFKNVVLAFFILVLDSARLQILTEIKISRFSNYFCSILIARSFYC